MQLNQIVHFMHILVASTNVQDATDYSSLIQNLDFYTEFLRILTLSMRVFDWLIENILLECLNDYFNCSFNILIKCYVLRYSSYIYIYMHNVLLICSLYK